MCARFCPRTKEHGRGIAENRGTRDACELENGNDKVECRRCGFSNIRQLGGLGEPWNSFWKIGKLVRAALPPPLRAPFTSPLARPSSRLLQPVPVFSRLSDAWEMLRPVIPNVPRRSTPRCGTARPPLFLPCCPGRSHVFSPHSGCGRRSAVAMWRKKARRTMLLKYAALGLRSLRRVSPPRHACDPLTYAR